MGGENPEVDGDGRDAFVGAGGAVRLRLDLLAHLVEVCEFLPLAVEEFGPFCAKTETERAREREREISDG